MQTYYHSEYFLKEKCLDLLRLKLSQEKHSCNMEFEIYIFLDSEI